MTNENTERPVFRRLVKLFMIASVITTMNCRMKMHGAPSVQQLLGMTRLEIEKIHAPAAELDGEGWAKYPNGLLANYADNICIRVILRIPEGKTCIQAAEWVGYSTSVFPLRKPHACLWPGISLKHRLKEGHYAKFDLKTGLFEIWLKTTR